MKINLQNYDVIGIIGLAKNTGKTTTLNALIKDLPADQTAITSIGLDGETIDQLTYLPKPKIYAKKGIIIATTTECLKQSYLDYETIESTNIKTAIGRVIIVKIISEGYIVVAGPTTNSALKTIIKKLKKYAKKILIDGAFNRLTFANIDCIGGIILATGASVNASMEKTVEYTQSILASFHYPKVKYDLPLQAPMMVQTGKETFFVKKKTSQALHQLNFKEPLQRLYIKGAITPSLIDGFIKHDIRNFTLILEDATKLLIPPKYYKHLKTLNIEIVVRQAINLIAVTINPTSPKGINYPKKDFLEAIQAISTVPVYNVKESEEADETHP